MILLSSAISYSRMNASTEGPTILQVMLSHNKITIPVDIDVVARDRQTIVAGLDTDKGISINEDASAVEFVF